ncbi:MAG TPA: hypothetical protein VHX88_01095 [Solirubrobacteraceae bacterium]|jgi:hypothetical protein|nr:hypothetical protein [Solirubrobacteraceae bacterium]
MTSPSPLTPDAERVLRVLQDARVEFVLIGGFAAALHGLESGRPTLTIVPARFTRNLDRLAVALRVLDARVRTPATGDQTQRLPLSATELRRYGRWTMNTQRGPVELDFEPPATAGHLDVYENARRMPAGDGVSVEVASIADLVRIAEMRMGAVDQALLPGWRARLQASSSISVSASV